MEDDFAGKEDTPTTATEVDKINTWNKTTTDDPVEAEILVEVNEVYPQIWQVPITPRILDTRTKVAKPQSTI